MASPQKENGYTSIANELLSELIKANLTLRELKVVMTVIRYTYGFNRKEAELSVRFISKATGIKYHHLSNSISSLESKNVLFIFGSNNHKQGRKLKLNKDYESWKLNSYQKSNSSQKSNGLVTEKVTETVTKKVTKKESKIKLKERDLFFENLIPDTLKGNGFLPVWKEWINYRKEIKKPIKETTAKKQLKFLSNVIDPEAVIEKSIRNGWQGLFPLNKLTTATEIQPEYLRN